MTSCTVEPAPIHRMEPALLTTSPTVDRLGLRRAADSRGHGRLRAARPPTASASAPGDRGDELASPGSRGGTAVASWRTLEAGSPSGTAGVGAARCADRATISVVEEHRRRGGSAADRRRRRPFTGEGVELPQRPDQRNVGPSAGRPGRRMPRAAIRTPARGARAGGAGERQRRRRARGRQRRRRSRTNAAVVADREPADSSSREYTGCAAEPTASRQSPARPLGRPRSRRIGVRTPRRQRPWSNSSPAQTDQDARQRDREAERDQERAQPCVDRSRRVSRTSSANHRRQTGAYGSRGELLVERDQALPWPGRYLRPIDRYRRRPGCWAPRPAPAATLNSVAS